MKKHSKGPQTALGAQGKAAVDPEPGTAPSPPVPPKTGKPAVPEVGTTYVFTPGEAEMYAKAIDKRDDLTLKLGQLEVEYQNRKAALFGAINGASTNLTSTIKHIAVGRGLDLDDPVYGMWTFSVEENCMKRTS